jgi:anti-sigma28 factor (negative regulator of flagellin synthesis)
MKMRGRKAKLEAFRAAVREGRFRIDAGVIADRLMAQATRKPAPGNRGPVLRR